MRILKGALSGGMQVGPDELPASQGASEGRTWYSIDDTTRMTRKRAVLDDEDAGRGWCTNRKHEGQFAPSDHGVSQRMRDY